MLAIVVTEHNTTSALQIVLNTFMIASSMSAADARPQPFNPLHAPTVFAFKLDQQSVGRFAVAKFGRSASGALCIFGEPRFMTSLHGAYSDSLSYNLQH
jgi:hypothetical protein